MIEAKISRIVSETSLPSEEGDLLTAQLADLFSDELQARNGVRHPPPEQLDLIEDRDGPSQQEIVLTS